MKALNSLVVAVTIIGLAVINAAAGIGELTFKGGYVCGGGVTITQGEHTEYIPIPPEMRSRQIKFNYLGASQVNVVVNGFGGPDSDSTPMGETKNCPDEIISWPVLKGEELDVNKDDAAAGVAHLEIDVNGAPMSPMP